MANKRSRIVHRNTPSPDMVSSDSFINELKIAFSETDIKRFCVISTRSLQAQAQQALDALSELATPITCEPVFVAAHTPSSDIDCMLRDVDFTSVDCLVLIGGGSVIDGGKVLKLSLALGINSVQELADFAKTSSGHVGKKSHLPIPDSVRKKSPRLIVVPTTLSGAHLSPNGNLINSYDAEKWGFRFPFLLPDLIVYDRQLCQQLLSDLWFSTAVRSIDHAIEGSLAENSYPLINQQMLSGFALMVESLRSLRQNSQDVTALANCQQAEWLCCTGFGRVAFGASHGIGYILGSRFNIPHGITSCVMLPAVVTWNFSATKEQQRRIATILDCESSDCGNEIRKIIADLGLPTSLHAIGINESAFKTIAEAAFANPVVQKNPRPVTSEADILEILQLAK